MVMTKNALFLALRYPNDEDISPDDEKWLDEIAAKFNHAELSFNQYDQASALADPKQEDTKHTYRLLEFEGSQLETAVKTLNTITAHADTTINSINEAQTEMKQQLLK